LAWLGGARHIVGYPCFYNYGRRQREKLPGLLDIAPKHDRSLTEVENCLRLVQDVLDDIGVPMPVEASTRLEYTWETSDDTARAAHLLAAKGISAGDYVVAAAPFSKRPAKNWPAARFVELFRQLCAAWRCRVLLLGGTAERALTDEVCAGVGPACTTCAGETTLGQSAVLLRRAQLFVGPDSGPAFLATAVGTPVVALYGPADFYRWRPPQNDVPRINIVHPLPCNPCRHQVCPLTPSCMERISVAEVVAACCRITEKAA
jgi:ADP-heptose:LPS heptosyltransferase